MKPLVKLSIIMLSFWLPDRARRWRDGYTGNEAYVRSQFLCADLTDLLKG